MSERHRAGLVYVGADDPARGADPLAEDPKPAQCSAADVQSAPAGSVAELREELAPGRLPHQRPQLQALQLRGLVGEQVALPRHRLQYLRPACGRKAAPAARRSRPTRAQGLARRRAGSRDRSFTAAPDDEQARRLGVLLLDASGARRGPPRASADIWVSSAVGVWGLGGD